MKKDKKKDENIQEVTEETATPSKEELLEKELAEKNDQFMRVCAEYDNFRKRSQKEKQDIYTNSKADVIKEVKDYAQAGFDRLQKEIEESL